MPELAADLFTRADNTDLGTAWDVQTGRARFGIVTNAAVPSVLDGDCGENYNGVTWPDNQYSEGIIGSLSGFATDAGIGTMVRASASAHTCYWCATNAASGVDTVLGKFIAGVFTQLGTADAGFVTGDTIYLEVQGSTLLVKKNGVTVIGPITDTSIASGRAGILYSSTIGAASLASWAGGDFAGGGLTTEYVAPVYDLMKSGGMIGRQYV